MARQRVWPGALPTEMGLGTVEEEDLAGPAGPFATNRRAVKAMGLCVSASHGNDKAKMDWHLGQPQGKTHDRCPEHY